MNLEQSEKAAADKADQMTDVPLPILPDVSSLYGVQGDLEMSDALKGAMLQAMISGSSTAAYKGADFLQSMVPGGLGLSASYAMRGGAATIDAISELYGNSFDLNRSERKGLLGARATLNSWSQGPVAAVQRGLNSLSTQDTNEKSSQSVVDVFAGAAKGFTGSIPRQNQVAQNQRDYIAWYNHLVAPFAI
jgi:hypothetical protein